MKIKKVLFVQKQPLPYFGILSLAAVLKARGYEVDVVITSLERNPVKAARESLPDVLCISAMSMERDWAAATAAGLRAAFPDAPIVLGGVHAILYPEDAISLPGVDYICTSEGEAALPNLFARINQGGAGADGIRGIWRKDREGRVARNEVEVLTEDLSAHIEERAVYYRRYPFMRRDATKFFLGSRGCPFKCSFCFNHQMQTIFRGKGRYIRFKRPEALLEEILRERAHGNLRQVMFSDDLFTMDKAWLRTFTDLYRREVGVPYMCQLRYEFTGEEVLGLLKQSGCFRVMFGLETGNEVLREKVLNKKIRNDDIKAMAAAVKRHGLQLHTFNIIGIPSETLENSFETVELNIAIKTDVMASSMCIPFPNTELARIAIDSGVLARDYSFKDIPQSFHRGSLLNMPDIEKQEKVHKISAIAVAYPRLYPVLRKIIGIKSPAVQLMLRPFFLALFLISFVNRYRGDNNSLWEMMRFIFRFRKSY